MLPILASRELQDVVGALVEADGDPYWPGEYLQRSGPRPEIRRTEAGLYNERLWQGFRRTGRTGDF
jgi:hypothetical protein